MTNSEVGQRRPAPLKHDDGSRLVTDSDREILVFVAANRLVLASHIQVLLAVSERVAQNRLATLEMAGLLRHHRVFDSQPSCYRITRLGLAAIKSELTPPSVDLHSYRKDIGVAWIWLAASRGTFGGDVERVMSELELRSRDSTRTAGARADNPSEPQTPLTDPVKPPFSVRLDGIGPDAPPRPHYPDLVLIMGPNRVAIELQLTFIDRPRLEQILAGYGAEPRITAVLYLVDDESVGRTIESAAAQLGMAPRVQIQYADFAERR